MRIKFTLSNGTRTEYKIYPDVVGIEFAKNPIGDYTIVAVNYYIKNTRMKSQFTIPNYLVQNCKFEMIKGDDL